ncbi:zinc finger, CCHC-type containing protein [Tanacetum coccineum]
MHFLLTTLKVVYVLSTPMPEFVEDETLKQTRKRCKWENDDYICRGHILNGMSDALFDVYQNVGSKKELWDQLESKYMAEVASSKKFLVSNFNNYKMVDSRGNSKGEKSDKRKGKEITGSSSVNMIEDGKNKNNNKNTKGKKRKNDGNNNGSNKKYKSTCWKCGKTGHFKKDCRVKKNSGGNTSGSGKGSTYPNSSQGLYFDFDVISFNHYVSHIYEICYVQDDAFAWWIDSGATCHACKDHCWFDTFHPVQDGSMLHMTDESTKPILGRGNVVLEFRNKKYVVTFIDDASRFCYVYLCHAKDEALDKFKIYKTEVKLQQNDLIKTLRTDRGGEYYDHVYFQSVGIIHKTMTPYTPQQNGVSERKNRALKEMVNSMLSYSGLSEGFWGEAMLTSCYLLNRVLNKRNKVTPCCKTFGLQMDLKRKMKVDGSIDKFKSRLVIQGFRKKEGIDYFDTYAHVARISTIRLLIALAATYNLVIHQMDIKTIFLNGDLEEEVYMKQPEGFIMPGNEHQDIGEVDVILSIRIKCEDKGITTTQSHYIEKILKKFKCDDCCPFSTPLDSTIKLMPNTGRAVDQLEYSRVIGCLMYAMTSTRPNIAYVVGKLSRYTSNPSTHHWHAIMRVFKYLKKTMDYGLSYVGFPSLLEGYSNASWITNSEDH